VFRVLPILGALFALLTQDNGEYQLVGPTVSDRAIVYERSNSVEDLPAGLTGAETYA
jgi:hypothetical protein